MRLQGRIIEWNDDRGFGFVATHGSSERHFFHVSEFPKPDGRPSVGQIVSYELEHQQDGKSRALKLRPAVTARAARPPARPGASGRPLGWAPDTAIATAYLAGPVFAMLDHRLPGLVLIVIAVMSALAFIMYNIDKRRAERGGWRVSENQLQVLGLLGGWPGALCAQRLFRHKSAKTPYVHVFRLAGLAGLAALVASAYPEALAFIHAR